MEPKTANIIDEEEIDDVFRDEINHYSASVPCQENVTQIHNGDGSIEQLEHEVKELQKVILSLTSSKFMDNCDNSLFNDHAPIFDDHTPSFMGLWWLKPFTFYF